MKLTKKIRLIYSLELLTGLHIGASSDNLEIGGIDKTVVRRSVDNVPYIPGSSLKGKIRSLLEQIAGSSTIGGNEEINRVFGFSDSDLQSKVIFRDAYLTKEWHSLLKDSEYLDLPFTEVKFENTIERITGKATNPRKIERIPAGACFNVEIIVNVWDTDNEGEELLAMLNKGINALENDYLGGSGSRGYGQVKLGAPLDKEVITFENYFADEN